MTAREMERRRASTKELSGFNTETCFTKELFQRRRRMSVLIKMLRSKMRISVRASEALFVLMTSLIILL